MLKWLKYCEFLRVITSSLELLSLVNEINLSNVDIWMIFTSESAMGSILELDDYIYSYRNMNNCWKLRKKPSCCWAHSGVKNECMLSWFLPNSMLIDYIKTQRNKTQLSLVLFSSYSQSRCFNFPFYGKIVELVVCYLWHLRSFSLINVWTKWSSLRSKKVAGFQEKDDKLRR